ncbi:MAG: DUF3857 domain-containing protein [Candidatus Accumulibacter phosphatis]|uniref:DUF3857 domain-containing protein n=1 Tax=Candidatus Accumulibacter phosphatis TaxID=327160 RepID=UPI001A41FA4D|nr:DUF3857 domain-containing protein [Candidatus Accumulibacter phosphatis]
MIAQRLAMLTRISLVIAIAILAGIADATSAQTVTAGQREAAVSQTAFVRGTALPEWFHPQVRLPESDLRAPAILRLSHTHFRVGAPASVVVHRAILVNEASALSEVGQYAIAFHPDYQHIELQRLKIYRGTQIIDKLDGASVRFYHSERNAEQGIYTGLITAVVITEDLRPGDTLEVIYLLVGQNPVFEGRYLEAAAWDSAVPVLKRRVTLDAPIGRTVFHRMIGGSGSGMPVFTESDSGARHLVQYEADNLAPVDQESMTPPDVQAMRWIQFSEYNGWRAVGEWANRLFATKETSSLQLPALPVGATKAEAAVRALQFVQEDIRYLSIAIGDNSHRPYPPEEVLARRYGDCKDKSLLLVALLRRLGIPADPVLISSQVRQGLRDMLPSPALFDHAIVRATIDGGVYFLDPTLYGQGSSLEHLSQAFQGAEGFIVNGDARGLDGIPVHSADRMSASSRSERVQVKRMDEPAEMQIEFAYATDDAEAMRRALARLSPVQIRKSYEGILDRRYPQARLVADPQIRDDRDKNLLVVDVRYGIPNLFERQDGKWNVRYEAGNLVNLLPVPASAKRRWPLFLPAYPWAGRYTFEITLPEDYDGRYTPNRRTLQSEAFQLDDVLSFSGRQLKAEVSLAIKRDRVSAAGTAQFLADLRKASDVLHNSLNITDRDKRSTPGGISLKELSRQRLKNVLLSTESALAAAELDGRETSGLRCEHALAAAYLEQLSTAQADADKAVAEQPSSAEALRCRGTVRFVSGDFDGSIRDLTRSLALGHTEPEIHFHRGLAHFYARQWTQAADDFTTFGARVGDGSAQARAGIWAALARLQAGQAVPDQGMASAVWPAPALGLFTNDVGVEDIVEALNRKESGTKLEEMLAEAYFYFYQHLASSNRARSQAYLKRSLELGPLYSLIQVAARHEIERLNTVRR